VVSEEGESSGYGSKRALPVIVSEIWDGGDSQIFESLESFSAAASVSVISKSEEQMIRCGGNKTVLGFDVTIGKSNRSLPSQGGLAPPLGGFCFAGSMKALGFGNG